MISIVLATNPLVRWKSDFAAHSWYPNTNYARRNILTTVPGGDGSVMVWGWISYDCKLDLITIPGTLNVQRNQDNAIVVPRFHDHALASRPSLWTITPDQEQSLLCISARARVQEQSLIICIQNVIETLPWPSRSPSLNPIESKWTWELIHSDSHQFRTWKGKTDKYNYMSICLCLA